MHINATMHDHGNRVDNTVSFQSEHCRETAKTLLTAYYTQSKETFTAKLKEHFFQKHQESAVGFLVLEYDAKDVIAVMQDLGLTDEVIMVSSWESYCGNYPNIHPANEGISQTMIAYDEDLNKRYYYIIVNLKGVSLFGNGLYDSAVKEWKDLVKDQVRYCAKQEEVVSIFAPLPYIGEFKDVLDHTLRCHNSFYYRMAGTHKVASRMVRKSSSPVDLGYVRFDLRPQNTRGYSVR